MATVMRPIRRCWCIRWGHPPLRCRLCWTIYLKLIATIYPNSGAEYSHRHDMTRYFLGVDIGGTKSHALIADETGTAIAFAEGGAGNHESVGWDGYEATITRIVEQAIAMAGITK